MADRIFSMFIEHAGQAHAALARELQTGDALAIARSAHALKSMCHSAGAARLAAILEGIERTAKAGRIDEARKAGSAVAAALDATIDAMDACICGIHESPNGRRTA
jgi:two-component system sensor histidine kinase BarA